MSESYEPSDNTRLPAGTGGRWPMSRLRTRQSMSQSPTHEEWRQTTSQGPVQQIHVQPPIGTRRPLATSPACMQKNHVQISPNLERQSAILPAQLPRNNAPPAARMERQIPMYTPPHHHNQLPTGVETQLAMPRVQTTRDPQKMLLELEKLAARCRLQQNCKQLPLGTETQFIGHESPRNRSQPPTRPERQFGSWRNGTNNSWESELSREESRNWPKTEDNGIDAMQQKFQELSPNTGLTATMSKRPPVPCVVDNPNWSPVARLVRADQSLEQERRQSAGNHEIEQRFDNEFGSYMRRHCLDETPAPFPYPMYVEPWGAMHERLRDHPATSHRAKSTSDLPATAEDSNTKPAKPTYAAVVRNTPAPSAADIAVRAVIADAMAAHRKKAAATEEARVHQK